MLNHPCDSIFLIYSLVGPGGSYLLTFSLLLLPPFSWRDAGEHAVTASEHFDRTLGAVLVGKLNVRWLFEGGRTRLESFLPRSLSVSSLQNTAGIRSLYRALGEGFERVPWSF